MRIDCFILQTSILKIAHASSLTLHGEVFVALREKLLMNCVKLLTKGLT